MFAPSGAAARCLLVCFAACSAAAQTPVKVTISGAPVPIEVLAQSPAETRTELQVICLFRSAPENTLHGSLVEANGKLHGLLDRIRTPAAFRGEAGETLVVSPPADTLGAKKLLIIGLGDSKTFTPERMQLTGEIVYAESQRLGVAHPYFAPTVLDGGVLTFTTGKVAEQVIAGFLRALSLDRILRNAHASPGPPVSDLTYLAGEKNVANTREGIERAIAAAGRK